MDETTDDTKKRKIPYGFILVLFIVGVTITPIWCFFVGPELRHKRLVSDGIAAHGRLLDVEETGTVINDSPELKLTVEFRRRDGTLDTASTDFAPTLRTVNFYQPGAMVTIAYDPKDTKEITLTEISTASTAPSLAPSGVKDDLQRQNDSLRRALDSISRVGR